MFKLFPGFILIYYTLYIIHLIFWLRRLIFHIYELRSFAKQTILCFLPFICHEVSNSFPNVHANSVRAAIMANVAHRVLFEEGSFLQSTFGNWFLFENFSEYEFETKVCMKDITDYDLLSCNAIYVPGKSPKRLNGSSNESSSPSSAETPLPSDFPAEPAEATFFIFFSLSLHPLSPVHLFLLFFEK